MVAEGEGKKFANVCSAIANREHACVTSLGLDIRTLALLLTVVLIAATLLMVLLAKLHPNIPGPRHWAGAMFLCALGFGLIFARDAIPPWWSVTVANALVFAGLGLLYSGLCRFLGRPPRTRLIVVIVLLFTVPFAILPSSSETLALRIIVFSLGGVLFSGGAVLILRQTHTAHLLAREVASGIFALHGVAHVIRIVWTLHDPPRTDLFQAGATTEFLLVYSIIAIFLITVIMALMTGERLQQELKHRLDELQQSHRQEAEARTAAQRLIDEQRELLAMVAHEVRNPVNTVLVASEILAAYLPPTEQEATAEQARIHRAMDKLSHLANDCLALDLIESRPAGRSMTVVEVGTWLSRLVEPQVLQSVPPAFTCVRGDEFLLRVAVDNLLDNARKYARTPEGVKMHAWCEGLWLHLEVSDDGGGIPEIEQPRLFDKFYRATNACGAAGAGLGLYLVQRIAALHDGEVKLVASTAQGSRFRLSLPLAEETGA